VRSDVLRRALRFHPADLPQPRPECGALVHGGSVAHVAIIAAARAKLGRSSEGPG
jgi:hypothetical protein